MGTIYTATLQMRKLRHGVLEVFNKQHSQDLNSGSVPPELFTSVEVM
jgi:hypothetical protein